MSTTSAKAYAARAVEDSGTNTEQAVRSLAEAIRQLARAIDDVDGEVRRIRREGLRR